MSVVSEARSRETGTVVQVVDNRDGGFDCGDLGWVTVCVEHGTVASHETRALAFRFRPVPSEWCENCMATVGYRDGHDDEYVAPDDDVWRCECGGEFGWDTDADDDRGATVCNLCGQRAPDED